MNANEFQKNLLKIMGLPEKDKRHKSAKSAPRILSETGKVVFEHDVIVHEQMFNEMETREIPMPDFPNLCALYSRDDPNQCICLHIGTVKNPDDLWKAGTYREVREFTDAYYDWKNSWESRPENEGKSFHGVYLEYKAQVIRQHGYWRHQFFFEKPVEYVLVSPGHTPKCINLLASNDRFTKADNDPRLRDEINKDLARYDGGRLVLYDEHSNVVDLLFSRIDVGFITLTYRGEISYIRVSDGAILRYPSRV